MMTFSSQARMRLSFANQNKRTLHRAYIVRSMSQNKPAKLTSVEQMGTK